MILETMRASCPGTCGEWVQGIVDGSPILVSAPINRYVEVEVETLSNLNTWKIPKYKRKVAEVLKLIQQYHLLEFKGRVHFVNELPEGKGMASSTADIATFAGTVFALAGIKVDPQLLAQLAVKIEPSDSVMFPYLTALDYIHGSYVRPLGIGVSAKVLALDLGGRINTLLFNSRQDLRAHYLKNEPQIQQAFQLLQEGIENSDLEKMAKGSTLSARCNLEINPKPVFKPFQDWVKHHGGLGLLTAHSGTLIAGVYPLDTCLTNLLEEAKERFYPLKVEEFQTVNGGVNIERRGAHARGQFALG